MALRQLRLTEPRPIVYPLDDALVAPPDELEPRAAWAAAWGRYRETYALAELAPITRPGGRLTIFRVLGLTEGQRAHVDNGAGAGSKMTETLAYGIVEIEGLMVGTVGGAEHELKVERVQTPIGKRLADAVLAELVDPGLRLYLCGKIIEAGGLDAASRKSDPAP
jgi:hypothetical protein